MESHSGPELHSDKGRVIKYKIVGSLGESSADGGTLTKKEVE